MPTWLGERNPDAPPMQIASRNALSDLTVQPVILMLTHGPSDMSWHYSLPTQGRPLQRASEGLYRQTIELLHTPKPLDLNSLAVTSIAPKTILATY